MGTQLIGHKTRWRKTAGGWGSHDSFDKYHKKISTIEKQVKEL